MNIEVWLLFFLSAVALSVTPGPNGLLCLNHGARYGLKRTIFTSLGSITGIAVLIGASLAGLGALMLASEALFTVVKWVGAAYLIFLGIRLWRSPGFRVDLEEGETRFSAFTGISRGVAFRQGLMVALSNPKALIFFATFLPQFMQPGLSLWFQFMVFAGTFSCVELAYEVFLAGMASKLAPVLARFGQTFNRITGSAFITVGALVATSDH